MIVIDTPTGIDRYRTLAIRAGLRACKVGMRVNTGYTPKRLMAATKEITGQSFKLRDYDGAIAALTAKLEEAE